MADRPRAAAAGGDAGRGRRPAHAAGHRHRRRDPADRRHAGHRLRRQLRRGRRPGAGGPQRPRRRRDRPHAPWRSPPASTSTPTPTSWWRRLPCADADALGEIVAELDRHIVGQDDAKRAVAIAIRNRWRRQQLPDDMRQEVAPKNILMIGPTGVGKTEIARRLAKLTGAPFIKVEATQVHRGRLLRPRRGEHGPRAGRERHRPGPRAGARRASRTRPSGASRSGCWTCWCPRRRRSTRRPTAPTRPSATSGPARRCARCWPAGELDERNVELTVEQKAAPMMFTGMGMEQMDIDLQGMFEKILPKHTQPPRDDRGRGPRACSSSRSATP